MRLLKDIKKQLKDTTCGEERQCYFMASAKTGPKYHKLTEDEE